MSEEQTLDAIAGLLEDRTARTILTATSERPMSASTLKQRCEASGPTVYRRLEALCEQDLLVEQTLPDPDGGHHRTVYAPNLDRVTISLEDGSFSVTVRRSETMADRLTRLVEEV